jgi:hypothetical protein
MKSITERDNRNLGDKMKDVFRLPWYFDKWYEKLILVFLCWFGLLKLYQILS